MNAALVAAMAFLTQLECQGLTTAQAQAIPTTSQWRKMNTHTNAPDAPTKANPHGLPHLQNNPTLLFLTPRKLTTLHHRSTNLWALNLGFTVNEDPFYLSVSCLSLNKRTSISILNHLLEVHKSLQTQATSLRQNKALSCITNTALVVMESGAKLMGLCPRPLET
jgi:hypothetical protein